MFWMKFLELCLTIFLGHLFMSMTDDKNYQLYIGLLLYGLGWMYVVPCFELEQRSDIKVLQVLLY